MNRGRPDRETAISYKQFPSTHKDLHTQCTEGISHGYSIKDAMTNLQMIGRLW